MKDSIINGKRYFKKINWLHTYSLESNFISWERNDTLTGFSFMLDFEDINENGDRLEEFPIDSLELPNYARYTSYKYSYRGWSSGYFGKKDVIIYDSSWAIFGDDTVLVRTVEYTQLFRIEDITDKFGTISFSTESPPHYLTGAIINGKQYGTIVSVKETKNEIPKELNLEQNYPNPFNPSTNIKYSIKNDGMVTIKVFDMLGKEDAVLVNEFEPAGEHEIKFDASNLASGVYLYTIASGNFHQTKKMILMR